MATTTITIKRLPCGISDFRNVVLSGYAYVDKTWFIEALESEPNRNQLFIRPRKYHYSTHCKTLFYWLYRFLCGDEVSNTCNIYFSPQKRYGLDDGQVHTFLPTGKNPFSSNKVLPLFVWAKFFATTQPIAKPYSSKATLVARPLTLFLNLITLFTFSIR
jgi:hypothetical protein